MHKNVKIDLLKIIKKKYSYNVSIYTAIPSNDSKTIYT